MSREACANLLGHLDCNPGRDWSQQADPPVRTRSPNPIRNTAPMRDLLRGLAAVAAILAVATALAPEAQQAPSLARQWDGSTAYYWPAWPTTDEVP